MKQETLNKKVAAVEALVEKLKPCKSIVLVDAIGLTVEEVTGLRCALHEKNCQMAVIKNNIVKRATEKLGIKNLENVFKGPTAVVTSTDETSALQVVYKFKKDLKLLDVKAGIINNEVFALSDLETLAKLPDKDGMLSMLLSVLQAPIRNMACVVKEVANVQAKN